MTKLWIKYKVKKKKKNVHLIVTFTLCANFMIIKYIYITTITQLNAILKTNALKL